MISHTPNPRKHFVGVIWNEVLIVNDGIKISVWYIPREYLYGWIGISEGFNKAPNDCRDVSTITLGGDVSPNVKLFFFKFDNIRVIVILVPSLFRMFLVRCCGWFLCRYESVDISSIQILSLFLQISILIFFTGIVGDTTGLGFSRSRSVRSMSRSWISIRTSSKSDLSSKKIASTGLLLRWKIWWINDFSVFLSSFLYPHPLYLHWNQSLQIPSHVGYDYE